MAELTTEYLDQKLSNQFKLTQEYLDKTLDEKLDKKLGQQTQELKAFTEEQVEKLAVMVQRSVVEPMDQRFDAMDQRFDGVDHRLDKVEGRLTQVETNLNGGTKSLRNWKLL